MSEKTTKGHKDRRKRRSRRYRSVDIKIERTSVPIPDRVAPRCVLRLNVISVLQDHSGHVIVESVEYDGAKEEGEASECRLRERGSRGNGGEDR